MDKTERGRYSPNDANMDALLTGFFEKEMPTELRGQPETPLLVSAHGSPGEVRIANSRKAGWLGLSVVSGCLLSVVVALSLPSSQPVDDSELSAAVPRVGTSADLSDNSDASAPLPTFEANAADVDVSTTDGLEVVERYDTVNGPVEQRSKLRIRNVSIFDPETGSKIEMTLPELDIEIFPIEDNGSEDNNVKNQSKVKSQTNSGFLHKRSVVITTADGKRYRVQVSQTDSHGKTKSYTLNGDLEEIRRQLDKLPAEIRDPVRKSLDRIGAEGKGGRAFRLQLRPGIEGTGRRLHLRLQQPGDNGAIRILELDLGSHREIKIDDLLQVEILEDELKRLPPEMRGRVKSTLRQTRIPGIRVKVERSQ